MPMQGLQSYHCSWQCPSRRFAIAFQGVHTLVTTTSLEARVARPVLVDTDSSDCGLLLEQPAVLMGGLGTWRSEGEFRAAGPRLRHAWNGAM